MATPMTREEAVVLMAELVYSNWTPPTCTPAQMKQALFALGVTRAEALAAYKTIRRNALAKMKADIAAQEAEVEAMGPEALPGG